MRVLATRICVQRETRCGSPCRIDRPVDDRGTILCILMEALVYERQRSAVITQ